MKFSFLLFVLLNSYSIAFSQGVVKIINAYSKNAGFVKYDEFGTYQHYPVAAGETIEINAEEPYLNMLALEDEHNVPYFFFAGDEITITGMRGKFYDFGSKDHQRSMELNASTSVFQSFRNRSSQGTSMKDLRQQTSTRIDSVLSGFPSKMFSPDYRKRLLDYYVYEILGQILKSEDPSNMLTRFDEYWQASFNRSLQSYIQTFRSYVLRYLPKFIPKENLLRHCATTFNGYQKEVALYTSMHMAFYRDKAWFRTQYDQYTSFANDQHFTEKLSYFKLSDEVTQNSNKIILINVEKDTTSLRDVLAKLKGKVVLIDLWASWCVPCLQQLPYSADLSATFQTKPFEVLYLSLDRELHLFARSSMKHLPGKLNYNVLGNFSSSFATINKITAIPRYMLIDKQGNIVNAATPYPSDESLRKLIEKYL